jgi:WD40 repeat protein/serine/threonine protein kinase/Flp pilus assembly protein TadD
MPEPLPSRPAADRNVLFGILALQMDLVNRDQLLAAMHAWVLDKARSLGQILVEQQALQPDEKDALDVLVQKHLKRHGGDTEKSLAALPISTPLRQELSRLADGDLQASLAHNSTAPEATADPYATGYAAPEAENGHGAAGAPASSSGQRFRILRPHARGGLGQVYVAHDEELHRDVALKEILGEYTSDADSRARFVFEAEVTGGLEHPGIVPIYGLGQHADGRPYYAMRFIQGETLKDAIRVLHEDRPDRDPAERAHTVRQLLGRFVAVCNAVAYAHSRGVLHRDLKPSNVLLGKFGETLVVDWGLAKAVGRATASAGHGPEEPSLRPQSANGMAGTQVGATLGTPAYMSPEQAAGQLDQLGPASDIYSLGATLYTLLAGRPSVESGDIPEMLRKVQQGDWRPPRQVKPDVPQALEAVCCKAMALRPEDRYGSALELAADVERWLADEPVAAWREPWAVRARRWLGRHRTLVTSTGAVVVVALLAATAGVVLLAAANERERDAKEGETNARTLAERKENEARLNLYISQMNLVQREYEANNIARVRELLEDQIPREPSARDWRGFEWHYWHRLSHRELLTLQGHTGPVRSVAFSPDGTRLASAGDYREGEDWKELWKGEVKLWDAATGQELLTLRGYANSISAVAFSPDGRRLAGASEDGTVRVWNADRGEEVLALLGQKSGVKAVCFSPDGKRLATASFDQTVRVWDAAKGQEVLTLKGHAGVVSAVAFSPDGKRLASASYDQTVRVWDAERGLQLLALKGHTGQVYGVCFSPDGKRLASAGDQTVRLWDAGTGQEVLSLQGHALWMTAVCFSPDGKRLASASHDQTVRLWDAGTGEELLALKGHTSGVSAVSFSPDGRRLASAGDQTVRLWDAGTGQEVLALQGHTDAVRAVAFSPDGQRLASASRDKTGKVWDMVTGQETFTLRHTSAVYAVAFSPDGTRLATSSFDRVRLWDAGTGQEVASFNGPTRVTAVAFSPDGRRLASASDDRTVRVWDTGTGQEVFTLKRHTSAVHALAFSPDGTRLASVSSDGHTVRVWDASTGQEVLTLQGHTKLVTAVCFSPDGERLATSSEDQTVRLWDAGTGQKLFTLKGHTKLVTAVCFSPDGRRLASASWDGTVRLWDTATGQEVLALKRHTLMGRNDAVYALAFSPDGQRLASVVVGGSLWVWEASAVPAEVLRQREVVSRQQELVGRVRSLFDKLLLRSEVLASLREEATLSDSERAFALQVAQTLSENPKQLNNAAWEKVKTADLAREAYALALRQADTAVRLAPDDGFILNTLGVAQYRTDQYAEAVATLTQSDKLNAGKDGSLPADLAFLAMAQHQLGRKEQAQATLARLREAMKQPRWAQDAESQAFLREAEALLQGKP